MNNIIDNIMMWWENFYYGKIVSMTIVSRKLSKYDVALANELDAGLIEDYKFDMPEGDPLLVPGDKTMVVSLYAGSIFRPAHVTAAYVDYREKSVN